jgi:tetratricopeptide (TPR) repeat protein
MHKTPAKLWPWLAALCLFALLPLAHAAEWSAEVQSLTQGGTPVPRLRLKLYKPGASLPDETLAKVGSRFELGQTLQAPAGAVVQLKSSQGNLIKLWPGARVKLVAGSEAGEAYELDEGKAYFDVRRALNFFNVRHGRFQAVAKGTRFSVAVQARKDITFDVDEGRVRVEREGKLRVGDGPRDARVSEARIRQVDTLNAGQHKTYSLDIDEYLARFKHFGEAEAYYRRNLVLARQANNREQLGDALNLLGIALATLGQDEEAVKAFEEWRVLLKQAYPDDRHPDVATCLNNLGVAWRKLGDEASLAQAITAFEESLRIKRELYGGQPNDAIAASLHNLGNAYLDQGGADNARQAIAHYSESLAMHRQLFPDGRDADIAGALLGLGNAYLALGGEDNARLALASMEDSLRVSRALYPNGRHADIARTLNSQAMARLMLRGEPNVRQAIASLHESLDIQRALYPDGRHAYIVSSLLALGLAYDQLEGTEAKRRAIEVQREALKLGRSLPPQALV